MAQTKIEWVKNKDGSKGNSWNPVTGCTKVSEGCQNCYAERMAKRFAGRYGYPKDNPFKVTLHPDRFNQPLSWKKSKMIFVCSMGDLFHEDVPERFIGKIFGTMVEAYWHNFLVLTKRPKKMCKFLHGICHYHKGNRSQKPIIGLPDNIWLGVSVENQGTADDRIPILLRIPTAVRFVSVEPMLEEINLIRNWINGLGWIITGCESGPGARPTYIDWIRLLRDQAVEAGVPFFLKQLHVNGRLEKDISKFPKDLQIREFPEVKH